MTLMFGLRRPGAEHDEHEPDVERSGDRHGEREVAAGDQDAAVEHGLALSEHAIGEPAARDAHQIDERRVDAVDRGGGGGVETHAAGGDGRGHIEDEEPAHPVVAEALPHLAEEQGGEPARMAEEAGIRTRRRRVIVGGFTRPPSGEG